jgi:hypothetical protein
MESKMSENIYNTCSEKGLLQSVGPYKVLQTGGYPFELIETDSEIVLPTMYGEALSNEETNPIPDMR